MIFIVFTLLEEEDEYHFTTCANQVRFQISASIDRILLACSWGCLGLVRLLCTAGAKFGHFYRAHLFQMAQEYLPSCPVL